jgi:two-component system, cell cycle response regulator
VGGPDDYDEEQTTTVQDVPVPASLRRARRPFVLEQVGGPGAPREFVLDLPEHIIGRSAQANISIDGNGISRQHVAIRRSGPEYGFVDMNSANGVYLNTVKTHAAILRQGDTLQLGDAVFVFHEGS